MKENLKDIKASCKNGLKQNITKEIIRNYKLLRNKLLENKDSQKILVRT